MYTALTDLRQAVYRQKEAVPALYGNIDFDATPERFSTDVAAACMLPPKFAQRYRPAVLADADRVARARLYTLLGDTLADRYAALMLAGYRMKDLIHMLHQACDRGVDNVANAPQELADLIHSMEQTPDWIDMKLVREGARVARIYMANLTPFALRGAFVATFMNQYSGLPMAITGALSKQDSSKQRINETASFFTAASLPGALDRDGAGFKAAAMVRLMHSMVRFNLINHSPHWNIATHGIPIPQVDQMPAGTMPAFLNAFYVVRTGKRHFSRAQRATAELCRYQSFLLGVPHDLLPATPQAIFDVMVTYAATLRDSYDDITCGAMVRATMAAYRPANKRIKSRLYNQLETSYSKVFFQRAFLRGGNQYKAAMMGVAPSRLDYLLFGATNLYLMPRLAINLRLKGVPLAGEVADLVLIRQIKRLLREYGHPEYITDVRDYAASRPVGAADHASLKA